MKPATLEDYLEEYCRLLEGTAPKIPPKRDVPPLFAYEKDGERSIAANLTDFDKNTALGLFKALLRAVKADRYVIMFASWIVIDLSWEEVDEGEIETLRREGTGGTYKDRRKEGYLVTVGDRERSLNAMFETERDYKGKIRNLNRLPLDPIRLIAEGRMIDLLVEGSIH